MEALKGALKADTLSLTSWQIGMYGWMAVCTFGEREAGILVAWQKVYIHLIKSIYLYFLMKVDL